MPSYDPNNIFAKILRGELPCYKVYEDDKALAFLERDGDEQSLLQHLHVHVIPRKAGTAMKPAASEKEKPDVLADQARKLAAALA